MKLFKKLTISVTVALLAFPLGAALTMAATPGETLYTTNCASCHGALAASTKKGATVAKIQAGIPSMPSISALSVADLTAIAGALSATPAATTPAATTPATTTPAAATPNATTGATTANPATVAGGQLPKTATPMYELPIIGAALTLVGAVGFKNRKRFG